MAEKNKNKTGDNKPSMWWQMSVLHGCHLRVRPILGLGGCQQEVGYKHIGMK
jgi:hypothetical protein